MLNWRKFKSLIPHRIQLNKNSWYEIVWISEFKDGNTLGEMRPDEQQIVIKTEESPKVTVITYLHEVLHSISDEYDVGLTETQILKLEKAFHYALKSGNIFKE